LDFRGTHKEGHGKGKEGRTDEIESTGFINKKMNER